jgi:phage-related tail protein
LKPKLAALTTATAPDPPTALQRAEVQNDMKQLQLYQAQVQILNYQFNQTKAALQLKLNALERAGWDLNLETWTYVPKGAPTTSIGK